MTQEQRERVEKLVTELEGDAYKQAQGALRRDDTYCCLGVACDLFNRATGQGKWVTDQGGWAFEVEGELPEHAVLPDAVADWYGFGFNPHLPDEGLPSHLRGAAAMNDNGSTFAEIAAALRRAFLAQEVTQ